MTSDRALAHVHVSGGGLVAQVIAIEVGNGQIRACYVDTDEGETYVGDRPELKNLQGEQWDGYNAPQ
jgi:hypothetical protein